MQAPGQHYTYTAADIERYYNGSMPLAEMHALEKAALDDPFLADALEGYMHTQTPVADVQELKEKIQRRSMKVVALPWLRRSVAMRVAALLILLVGIGWLGYSVFNGKMENLALQSKPAPKMKSEPLAPRTDTVVAAPAEQTGKEETGKKEAVARVHPTSKKRPIPEKKTMPVPEKAPATALAPQPQTFSNAHVDDVVKTPVEKAMPSLNKTARLQNPVGERSFSLRVIDTSGNPVPFATAYEKNHNRATQADAQGNLSLTAPDSSLTVMVQATGFKTQQMKLRADDTTRTITLPRAEAQLNEVVVTALGKNASRSRVRLEAAKPRGGQAQFDKYVDENLDWPVDDDDAGGEVTLSFDVDKKGNAVAIQIEQSLCERCDSTAVKLIRDGAKWRKTNKEAKAKAHIRF